MECTIFHESISSDSADFCLELLFGYWLGKLDVLVCSDGNVSVGVEFNWALAEDSALTLLLFVVF